MTSKAQFGFDTAFAFLVILLIIFTFNAWKSQHLSKTRINLDVKSNNLLKIYPLLDKNILIEYKDKDMSLNFYTLLEHYLKNHDKNLVNKYCKKLKELYGIKKLFLSINETEFDECNDDIDAFPLKVQYFTSKKSNVNIKIGALLETNRDEIYFYFLEKYKELINKDK